MFTTKASVQNSPRHKTLFVQLNTFITRIGKFVMEFKTMLLATTILLILSLQQDTHHKQLRWCGF